MKKRAEIVVFLLGLAIILLAALNSSRFFARLDLTKSKAFSISLVSKKLFQEIPEQVYITFSSTRKGSPRSPRMVTLPSNFTVGLSPAMNRARSTWYLSSWARLGMNNSDPS